MFYKLHLIIRTENRAHASEPEIVTGNRISILKRRR